MEKPLKIIFTAIATMVLLMVATLCILPFVIDLNDFKPKIIAAVSDMTHRELVLEGNLKLSLFPWTGISTGKITLNNTLGFPEQPFATIEQSEVEIQLLPLLSRKIEISRMDFKGLVLNLVKNKQGTTNWTDLSNSRQTVTQLLPADGIGKPEPKPILATFAIGGITIENARINWDNLETGQHIELRELNLNSDKFAFDEPIGITASLIAESKAPLAIKVSTELSVNEQLDTFALRHSNLQVTASGETVPGNSLTAELTVADVALDMAKQTAKIYGLLLKLDDMTLLADLTGTSIKENPSFQGPISIASFNPAKIIQQLSIALPVMQAPNALSKLSANFDLTATSDSANLQNLDMMLDDSRIKGLIDIKADTPRTISFNLDIDTLDADRYLPPVNKSSRPLASPSVLLAAGIFTLPVETLRKLNADGTVSLNKLKADGLAMQDVQIHLNAKNGVLSTQQSVKQLYQGSYFGSLNLDTHGDKPLLTVKEKIDHIQIEPLLKDYQGKARISGIVNASAQLQGQGDKIDELKTTLNGQLSFLFKEGAVKGFNLQKIIDEGKALIKGSASSAEHKDEQTLFSEMSGSATITQGLLHNSDLVAKSSNLRVDGKGSLNLNSETLDYKVDAKMLSADEGMAMQDATAEGTAIEPKRVKGALTVKITGTLSNPSYTIDIASLLTDKNKAKINKLINKLDKKLGGGVGDLLKNFLK